MPTITAMQRKELLRQVEQDGNQAIMDSDQDLKELRENLEIGLVNLTDVKNIWDNLQDKLEQADRMSSKLGDMGYSVTSYVPHRYSQEKSGALSAKGKTLTVCDCGPLSKKLSEAIQPVKDLKRKLSDRISSAQTDIIMAESMDEAKKAMIDFQSMVSDIHKKTNAVIKQTEVKVRV